MSAGLVLFVDDEEDALSIVSDGLSERGYRVLTAKTGAEALQLLKTNKPDAIIADLRMQPMNGFELFQQIKKIPKCASIPFFFLTAVDDPLSQKYSASLGVDAYIVKPIDIDHLDFLISSKTPAK